MLVIIGKLLLGFLLTAACFALSVRFSHVLEQLLGDWFWGVYLAVVVGMPVALWFLDRTVAIGSALTWVAALGILVWLYANPSAQ